MLAAQMQPDVLRSLDIAERIERMNALAAELYSSSVLTGLQLHMRVSRKTANRWVNGETPVPLPVLVALGAMVQAKRAGV